MAQGMRTAVVLGALMAALGGSAAHAATAPRVACTDRSDGARRLDLDVRARDTGRLEPAFGYYAVPRRAPRGLVVFAHGHGNSAWRWRPMLAEQARRLGVVAVAMDFRRQTFPGGDITRTSYGWRVREGAEDSIAAAKLFERRCLARGRRRAPAPVVMYGVSMGGNASGLAVAAGARRADRSPLFDHWFDIEGVTNVIETYLEARLVAGPPLDNATGRTAVGEIEQEMGGPLESRARVYARHAVVLRARDIRAAGLRGAVIVHGVGDGTVPFNQSPEMFARLAGVGIPTELHTVGRNGGAPSGTTLEDLLGVRTLLPGYASPLSGHGSETDSAHPVIRTGLERLAALFAGRPPRRTRAFVVDGGVTAPRR